MGFSLQKVTTIGVEEFDEEIIIHQKQFVVYEAILMSLGGVMWGVIALLIGKPFQAIIPFGYVILSFLNMMYFSYAKKFNFTRDFQTAISLILPFLFQWVLGGFYASGGVMMWALLSLAASLSYMNTKNSLVWLGMYTVLTVISGVFDKHFQLMFPSSVDPQLSIWLITINVAVVSVLIFVLIIFYVLRHANSYHKLKDTNTKLIQAEKMAALGQLSAGIAHEVNTPLGAIKACAEQSSFASKELFQLLNKFEKEYSEEEREKFLSFLTQLKPSEEVLSTREERSRKKELTEELESLGVEKSRFLAEKLVQTGIYHLPKELHACVGRNIETCILIMYNVFNQERNTKTITLAVDKASRVIKALKMYLHTSGSLDPEEFDVNESINTVLTIYHNQMKHGVEVIRDLAEVPRLKGFIDELNQIWTNIIVNACQAMKYNGKLVVSTKQDGDFVKVSFSDNGPGIPKEIQGKIFDAFFTTKVSGEGTGLGLDIVKKILRKHKGKIDFETEVNKGTTFNIYLPING